MRLYLDYSAVNSPILALSVSYNCTYLEIVILEKEDLSSPKVSHKRKREEEKSSFLILKPNTTK